MYRRKAVSIQRWWRGKRACQEDNEAHEAAASAENGTLSAEWRSIIQRISSVEALEDNQEFCRRIRNPISQIDVRVDQDALERNGSPQTASDPDRRLAQLGVLITSVDEKEKSVEKSAKNLGWVLRVWKRMHVVELAERYMEEVEAEDAMPKQGGRPSVMDRFTDVMFPDTRGTGKGTDEKRRVRKKSKQVSQEERKQVEEQRMKRTKAVRKVEYWKRLGMALLGAVQCYGYGILVRLPRDLTETR